jgi:outer membrane protein assembly factor BamB
MLSVSTTPVCDCGGQGDERWAAEIGATLVGSPAVADGTVYVGTAGNALAALREA